MIVSHPSLFRKFYKIVSPFALLAGSFETNQIKKEKEESKISSSFHIAHENVQRPLTALAWK